MNKTLQFTKHTFDVQLKLFIDANRAVYLLTLLFYYVELERERMANRTLLQIISRSVRTSATQQLERIKKLDFF